MKYFIVLVKSTNKTFLLSIYAICVTHSGIVPGPEITSTEIISGNNFQKKEIIQIF